MLGPVPGPGVPLTTPRPAAGGFPGAPPGSAAGMPHAAMPHAAMPLRPGGSQPAAGMPGYDAYAGQVRSSTRVAAGECVGDSVAGAMKPCDGMPSAPFNAAACTGKFGCYCDQQN